MNIIAAIRENVPEELQEVDREISTLSDKLKHLEEYKQTLRELMLVVERTTDSLRRAGISHTIINN